MEGDGSGRWYHTGDTDRRFDAAACYRHALWLLPTGKEIDGPLFRHGPARRGASGPPIQALAPRSRSRERDETPTQHPTDKPPIHRGMSIAPESCDQTPRLIRRRSAGNKRLE